MATLALQEVQDGLDNVTFQAAAAGGDQVPCGAMAGGWNVGALLLIKNGAVGAVTVTVDTPGALDNLVVTVPASTGEAVVPVNAQIAGSLASVTYSAVTSVTVAAIGLTRE